MRKLLLAVLILVGCSGQFVIEDKLEDSQLNWLSNTVSVVLGKEDSNYLMSQHIAVGTIIHASEKGIFGVTVNHALQFNPNHIGIYNEAGPVGFAKISVLETDSSPLDMAIFSVDLDKWPIPTPVLSDSFDPNDKYITARIIERGIPYTSDIENWDKKKDGGINRYAARVVEALQPGDSGSGVYDGSGRFYGMIRAYRTKGGEDPNMAIITSSQRIKILLDSVLNK